MRSSPWSGAHCAWEGLVSRPVMAPQKGGPCPRLERECPVWRPERRPPWRTLSESERYSVNNHMSFEADPSPVEVQMRPQPQWTPWWQPYETMSRKLLYTEINFGLSLNLLSFKYWQKVKYDHFPFFKPFLICSFWIVCYNSTKSGLPVSVMRSLSTLYFPYTTDIKNDCKCLFLNLCHCKT